MIAIVVYIALVGTVAGLVGIVANTRMTAGLDSACTQNCRQGRDCSCSRSAASREPPP
jgi:hypothetical protein